VRTVSDTRQVLAEPTTCDGTSVPSTRTLTIKQRAVIRLVSLGCTVAETALVLHISERTAENHKNRAMDRLGIHKAALLARFAIENGIAPVGDSLTDDERHDLSTLCAEIGLDGDSGPGENGNGATD
jgi:DNA-binding CsgD family transcriptional regulator